MSETVTVLGVCVDCYLWLELGPEDPYSVWTEGYTGPELLEPLAFYRAEAVCDDDGETLEPYYSSSQCLGCGSGLAGDRVAMAIGLRGEGQ